jgi:hypothetical protein
MAFIDRYTLLKWKEAFSNLTESLTSASPKTRLVVAGSLLGILLIGILLSLMFSVEQAPPAAPDRTLTVQDTQGDQWILKYLPGQDGGANQAAAVKPGPPLSLTLRFQLRSPNLLILPELTGAAGEKYYPAAVKNGKWQPPPKLTITDAGGRLLHRGQFEFG